MSGRWKIKAVVIGALVDLGGSFLVGLLVIAVAGARLAARGVPSEQLAASLHSFDVLLLEAIVGTGFSLLGGYVAARLSKRAEVQHALASAVPCLLLNVILGAGSLPTWYWLLGVVTVPPVAALGGIWGRARNSSQISRAV